MADEFEIPMPVYRVPRRRSGIDPATRRLLMIAGGLGGALLLVVGIARLTGHHPGGVPVIEAASGPVRVRPADPGGMSVAGQQDEVLSDQAGTAADKLAPAAETPSLQALHAQEQADAARAAPPAGRAEAAKTAQAEAPAHAARPTEAAGQEARTAPAETPAAAAQTPAAQASAPQAPAEGAAPAKAPPAAAVAASPARHAAAASSAGHGAEVQLGALGSEEAAHQEWTRLARRLPGLLDGRTPAITRVDHDGRTLWRLRTGGFGSVADATAFCARVRAKGQVCSIAAL